MLKELMAHFSEKVVSCVIHMSKSKHRSGESLDVCKSFMVRILGDVIGMWHSMCYIIGDMNFYIIKFSKTTKGIAK